MNDHACERDHGCICRTNHAEPHPECPRHGAPERWHCKHCGKFMKSPAAEAHDEERRESERLEELEHWDEMRRVYGWH